MGCTVYRDWTYFGIQKISYKITEKGLTIYDSYKIKDDTLKWKFINDLYSEYYFLRKYRSKKSFFREWKSHNILFNRNIRVDNTRDTDIEFRQCLLFKIGYWFVSKFFKE